MPDAKIDPTSAWTGTWRDPRFSPPADGGRPENALTGTLFVVNGHREDSISVPASYGPHRFWRNTSVATLTGDQVATFPAGTLGYEWDSCPNNGVQPAGLMRLSSTTLNNLPLLQDYGSTYSSGQATHSLSLYRHSSGALVFGAGTVQWAWGLDSTHDNGSAAADTRMRQATVNFSQTWECSRLLSNPVLRLATQVNRRHCSNIRYYLRRKWRNRSEWSPNTHYGHRQGFEAARVWGVEVSTDGGYMAAGYMANHAVGFRRGKLELRLDSRHPVP